MALRVAAVARHEEPRVAAVPGPVATRVAGKSEIESVGVDFPKLIQNLVLFGALVRQQGTYV